MTSIEWLINWGKENPVAFQSDYYEAIEKAKEMHKQEMDINCSQQEISDEEIDKAGIKNSINYKQKYAAHRAFREGAQWYREQLKQNK
jgi:hypothetical protein